MHELAVKTLEQKKGSIELEINQFEYFEVQEFNKEYLDNLKDQIKQLDRSINFIKTFE